MGKNSKSPRPQGQIKKFIGPYQITWTFVNDELEEFDPADGAAALEEDVSIAGSEKTYLSYFIILRVRWGRYPSGTHCLLAE